MSGSELEKNASGFKRHLRDMAVPTLVVGGILVMGISLVLVSARQLQKYPHDASHAQTEDPLWPLVMEIAKEFWCGCGKCGEMPLVECICDDPSGGIAEKRFIRTQLVEGRPKGDIIALVQDRFGRRVPTTAERKILDSGSTALGPGLLQ